jgi:hypothetical protein
MALIEAEAEITRDDVLIAAKTIGRMLAARPAQLKRCGVGESAQAAFRSVREVAVALNREEIVGRDGGGLPRRSRLITRRASALTRAERPPMQPSRAAAAARRVGRRKNRCRRKPWPTASPSYARSRR